MNSALTSGLYQNKHRSVYECPCVWPLGVQVSCDLHIYLFFIHSISVFSASLISLLNLKLYIHECGQMISLSPYSSFTCPIKKKRRSVWSLCSLLSPPGRTRQLVSTSAAMSHEMHSNLLLLETVP